MSYRKCRLLGEIEFPEVWCGYSTFTVLTLVQQYYRPEDDAYAGLSSCMGGAIRLSPTFEAHLKRIVKIFAALLDARVLFKGVVPSGRSKIVGAFAVSFRRTLHLLVPIASNPSVKCLRQHVLMAFIQSSSIENCGTGLSTSGCGGRLGTPHRRRERRSPSSISHWCYGKGGCTH